MKIALLGYGNMGKAIEKYIQEYTSHEIVCVIHEHNQELLTAEQLSKADVAIDFSLANAAVKHISSCFFANIPIVSGTTGWLQDWNTIQQLQQKTNGALLYSSNFSIGVHLFWNIVAQASKIMNEHTDYNVMIHETHHTQKKDAPSGTAITTAQYVIDSMTKYNNWSLNDDNDSSKIPIFAHRVEQVPGTHTVYFENPIDTISIEHKAKSRLGFVQGAVKAAEFLVKENKAGMFSLNDLLK